MRILFLNQFYWPDVAPTGIHLADLVEHLVEGGHQVSVVCSRSAYGALATAGDGNDPTRGVRVIRVPGVPFSRKVVSRLPSYLTFFSGAFLYCLFGPKQDLVVSMTTPPMLSVIGAITRLLRGNRCCVWEMDVFPDVLATTGVLSRQSLIYKTLEQIQGWARRRSDGIIALGPCMRERLVNAGTPPELVKTAENWADSRTISPKRPVESERLTVLYSGNFGLAHDVKSLLGALRFFKGDGRFWFHFTGSGSNRDYLRQICEQEVIDNVTFSSYVERSQMSEHLAKADIGLVTERPECLGTVVPSKMYSLMAAARPILFIGCAKATPSLVLQRFGCGWQIDPGDTAGLIALLQRLAADKKTVRECGYQGLEAFQAHYDVEHGVTRVAEALGLLNERPATARAAAAAFGD